MAKVSNQAELGALRAEAAKAHRNASKKISRNRVKRGAEIGGSEFDPRKPMSNIKRYNRKQLDAYIRKLNDFNSRKTQFVPDSKYRPMPADKWRQYKSVEKDMNTQMQKRFASFADRVLPNGMTVAQRLAMTETIHPQMHNPASDAGVREIDRRSKSIRSLQALNKLIIDTKRRGTPKDRERIEKANRKSVNSMLDAIGNDDWRKRIAKLSSGQFDILWNASGDFANAMSMYYEITQKLLSGADAATRWMESVSKNAVSDIEEFLKWIESQD